MTKNHMVRITKMMKLLQRKNDIKKHEHEQNDDTDKNVANYQ